MTVLPVTSTVTGATPLFRLRIAPTSQNGLHAPSEVMVDRAMTVRPEKGRGTIGEVNETDTLRINRALALFLGIAGDDACRRRNRKAPNRRQPSGCR